MRVASVKKPAVIAITSTIVIAGAIAIAVRQLGLAITTQLAATLFVPALVIVLFWTAASQVIAEREAAAEARLELSRATSRATNDFLASVAYELKAHPEKTSLRAESLAVAMEYRDISEDIKVAVPDVIVSTDALVVRQILHTLAANAMLHGGQRVAIWGELADSTVTVTVSDDGPGVAKDVGDHLFERFVDLGASALDTRAAGSGLSVARELAALIDGELSYRRDSTWSHFTLSIPLGADAPAAPSENLELEAQVG